MDAGLAAVLGALAGSVATIGAALATGWSAREQAKMTARAEHLRQRRDSRQSVYEEFIEVAVEHANLTKILLAPAPQDFDDLERLRILPPGMTLEETISESKSLHEKVRKISTRVQIAGPKEVSAAVAVVSDKSGSVYGSLGVTTVTGSYPGARSLAERWEAGCRNYVEFSGSISEFTEKVRIALDNDGTKE
ncbi:hypothetical protein [Streptomyces sp. NPDC006855]|uniref:hypothetical protein n=1 Tax=Streptomyces sp. NPDC006855 TaxID=3364765 RepID=UPI003686A6F4